MKMWFHNTGDTFKKEGLLFILFLAACFTHNMDWGSIVYVGFLPIVLIIVLFRPIKRLFDRTLVSLLLFGVFYILFSPAFDFENAIRVLLGPSLFYIYGRYTVIRSRYNSRIVRQLILLMIIAISFPVWWAVINNILSGNVISITSEEGARWLTTWGQSHMAAATTYGLIASFGLCGFGYFIMSKEKNSSIDPWVFLLCSVCSLLTTTYLINRSGIVIIGIATLVAFIYGVRDITLKTVLPLLFFFVILFVIITKWGGTGLIADAYSERESIALGGDRTWRWVDALGRIFTRPFGWSSEDQVGYYYVHNMWLDVARVAGIVPFIALLFATFFSLKYNVALFRAKGDELSLILLSLYCAVFSAYMIEPVIEANIFYLMIFTWIWGVEKEVAKIQFKL